MAGQHRPNRPGRARPGHLRTNGRCADGRHKTGHYG